MLRIAISGSTGRMGLALIDALSEHKDLKLVGGVAREKNKNIGKDLGEIAGEERIGDILSSNLNDLPQKDVLIDFSEPNFSLRSVEYAKKNNKPLVLGTTGYQDEDLKLINDSLAIEWKAP